MARTKPTSLKSNKKYKDAPRFKAIYGYEDAFKKDGRIFFKKMAIEMIQESEKILKS